jgi:hypothetical protein
LRRFIEAVNTVVTVVAFHVKGGPNKFRIVAFPKDELADPSAGVRPAQKIVEKLFSRSHFPRLLARVSSLP